jgi:hypothetical protein
MRKIDVSPMDIEPNPGPAPMLQWIEITQLVVDETYQRDLSPRNWAAIRRIAEDFKWSRFSPVFCAPVEGGAFAIIDGQHRTHAAALCGFKSVPCQVVQMERDEQANAFSAVNGNVTAITGFNLFRAEIASGNPEAVALVALAQSAGCAVSTANASAKAKKPGVIYFLGGIKDLFRRHGAVLGSALTLLRQAEYWRDEAELWGGNICRPTLQALCERPEALADPRFRAVIEGFDVWSETEKLADIRKRRLRSNLVAMTGQEALRQRWLEYIDERFPERRVA